MMKKLFLAMLCTILSVGLSVAQTRTITGVVTSAEDGEPVIGASIQVKGTMTGTVTDVNGNFSLGVSADARTLVVSYIGMKTKEVPVSASSRIVLEAATQALDEVIVVAYGTAKKSTFTGSAVQVSSDALKNARVESLDKALAGKTSGVRVSSYSGDPGSAGEIQVRGIGSITGSTTPLYVIDGVPVVTTNFNSRAQTSILSAINPNDIETMTVLKDAAAASLYGSRAANGVVIITTKKGKQGKARINFQANYGVSSMATNSYDMMSGTEMYDYFKTTLQNTVDDGNAARISGYASFGTPDSYLQDGWGLTRQNGENWRDFIYENGSDQNYQISVSSGTENTNYYVSAGYQNVKGMVRSTGFERYSGVFNTNTRINKWLAMEGKAQLSYTTQQGIRDSYTNNADGSGIGSFSPSGLLFQTDPTKFPYNEDGSVNEAVSLSGTFLSPVYELGNKNKFLNTDNARAILNYNIELNFTDYLKFRTVNSVDFVDMLITEYWGPKSGDGRSANGMGQKDFYRTITLTSSDILQFTKTFNDVHNVDLLGGFEAQKYLWDFTQAAVNNYSTDKLPDLSVGTASRALGEHRAYYLQSWLFNANYNYMQKYYLGGNIRTDESSKLGANNRKGTFFSVSGSWRFTEESFLAENPILTDGKIRASYGTNGNLPGSMYGSLDLYTFSGKYGPSSAIYPTQPANYDLGWEKSKNLNIGIDWTLFDRYSFSLEYFNKKTTDLLMNVPTSIVTGFTSALQNIGDISNKGVDFEFHGKDVLSTPLKWDVDFIASTLKAKVDKLANGEAVNIGFIDNMYRYEEGKDLYSFYVPTWAGVNPETGQGEFLIDPTKPYGEGNVTTNQAQAARSIVAKAYPDITGAFGSTLSYKGFSLNFLLTYQFGGHIYDYGGYFLHSDGRRLVAGWNQSADIIGNYWTKPGDKVDNVRPTTLSKTSDLMSSRWIYSSDFIRFKEVGLYYAFPKSLTNKMHVGDLSINIVANNLAFLYAATKNIELETPLNGFKSVDTPLARTITFGLNLSF